MNDMPHDMKQRMHIAWRIIIFIAAFYAPNLFAAANDANAANSANAGISSAHPLATAAGIEMLKRGGNAFDAAVAISAALAVVEPAGSGLGGGGFWLLHSASGESVMIDGREKAPLAATRDMYLDKSGKVIDKLSIDGALAAAIPGAPAALVHLSKTYGALPLAVALSPAIRLAENGFTVDERYRRLIEFRLDAIRASPAAAEIFLVDGEVPLTSAKIVQRDLANTLRALAKHGHDGFYRGAVAKKLVAAVREAGGIWTAADLENYHVAVRAPVVARYKDMKITSAALPSSGGLVLALAFNMLAGLDIDTAAVNDADYVHLIAEALRRAYRDRALYLGDSDFVEVPIAKLLDINYAARLRESIDAADATPSAELSGGHGHSHGHGHADAAKSEGTDTTHFSVIDSKGNRVAATLSINYPFGSGMVARGSGVLLNDEMDDFSAKPGAPNVYGLVGGKANAIEGGKRMLSSMSPSFFEKEERIAVIGTPGGSRIISMLLLAAFDFYRGATAAQIVNRPRFHHQYLPDAIQFEPDALSPPVIENLRARGHRLDAKSRSWGNMHAVIRERNGTITAAADGRGNGEACVFWGDAPKPPLFRGVGFPPTSETSGHPALSCYPPNRRDN